ATKLPESVVYAGPEIDDPSWSEPFNMELAGDPAWPLILVGLSTTFQDQVAAIQRVLDATESLPVRVLVTTGETIEPWALRAPANATVCKVVGHGKVLPHAALTITHAGHGTVIRSLAHGVPLLCLPMGRDQDDNAVRVVARGAGLRLKPTASVEQL